MTIKLRDLIKALVHIASSYPLDSEPIAEGEIFITDTFYFPPQVNRAITDKARTVKTATGLEVNSQRFEALSQPTPPRKPRRTSCHDCGELDIAAKRDDPHPVYPKCRREQLGQEVEIEKEQG